MAGKAGRKIGIQVENSSLMVIRVALIQAIAKEGAQLGIRQVDIAERWGVTQTEVSRMMRGVIHGVSLERLMVIAAKAEICVTLSIGGVPVAMPGAAVDVVLDSRMDEDGGF